MSEAAESKPKKQPARQVSDPELVAMHEITEVLGELDENQQSRVVHWMHDRWVTQQPPFKVE